MIDVLQQLKSKGLLGRGGGCFPTWKKWEIVKKAKGEKKFVICNGSEGEPGVKKDEYILENYPEVVIDGMRHAIQFFNFNNSGKEREVKGIIYLNHKFYKKFHKKLKNIIGSDDIEVFKKPLRAGYVGGEETALINTIEGKRTEPRIRPPFPGVEGLHSAPTLVNNVETFYDASLLLHDSYKNERFYTITGDVLHRGVYSFPEDATINEILHNTHNHPLEHGHSRSEYDFFVQVGGDGSGIVLNSDQLDTPVGGSGSIKVFSLHNHSFLDLIKYWTGFFMVESCGQCVPCREGTYRLNEFLKMKNVNWKLFFEILSSTKESSFCALGGSVHVPVMSYINNIVKKYPPRKINMTHDLKQVLIDSSKICNNF